jgi:hypothetical protein
MFEGRLDEEVSKYRIDSDCNYGYLKPKPNTDCVKSLFFAGYLPLTLNLDCF